MDTAKKTDLRVVKTYSSLINAFYKLLSEKHFEDITINELCNRAGIRRATFYKHFTDKNEFLTFVVHNLFEQYSKSYDNQIHRSQPLHFYMNITRNILYFLTEREQMVHLFAESNMYSTLMAIFTDEISKEITEYLREDIANGTVLPASPEMTAQFFTGALINCIKCWFSSDRKLSEDEMLAQLQALLFSFHSKSSI